MAQHKAFKLGGIGSKCCCGTVCNIIICVQTCTSGFVAGATVQIKSGATVIATGTTNSVGCVTFTTVTAGTYTIDVTTTNLGSQTFPSQVLSCGHTDTVGFGGGVGVNTCCGSCLMSQSNLQLTDANHTLTLSFNGIFWYGCYYLSTTGYIANLPGCVVSSGSISLPICYSVQCDGTGTKLIVQRSWYGFAPNGPGTPPYGYFNSTTNCGDCPGLSAETGMCGSGGSPANPFVETVSNTSAWTSCAPISWSGTLSGTTFTADPVGGTVTITD